MNNKLIKILAICLMISISSGCGGAEKSSSSQAGEDSLELTRYTASFLDVFDTKTDIVGYAKSEEEFTEKADLLKEKLTEYHQLYDIYNGYEGLINLYMVNQFAAEEPVEVSAEIMDLLLFGKAMYEETGGQTNIAMGSVLSIWHTYREEGLSNPDQAALPTMDELTEAASHMDMESLVLDEENSTVYFADPLLKLDVGGIAKGYAVQRLSEYASELGMQNILISVGGNISANGLKIDGSKWVLGIQNPDLYSEEEYVQRVQVQDRCVVTSGDYQRYYIVDDEKYCHIIDPDTLMPAAYCASVSVITEDSGRADALSTALFNMPVEEGIAYVDNMEDVEAMWVLSDGTMEYSEHFYKFVME